jgi:hypothetical protein
MIVFNLIPGILFTLLVFYIGDMCIFDTKFFYVFECIFILSSH